MSSTPTNGTHARLTELERRMQKIEDRVEGQNIGALTTDVSYCRDGIKTLHDKVEDEARYNRRMMWSLLFTVAAAMIMLALSSGVHPL